MADEMAVAVVDHGGGKWSVTPIVDGDHDAPASLISTAELSDRTARLEAAHHPRWVWADTESVYRPLVAAGVHVDRCHDLGHIERLLAPALASDTDVTTDLMT